MPTLVGIAGDHSADLTSVQSCGGLHREMMQLVHSKFLSWSLDVVCCAGAVIERSQAKRPERLNLQKPDLLV